MNIPQSLTTTTICRGTIFYSDIFDHIDHSKYFVIMGENDRSYVGFFYINSDIHYKIKNKTELANLQYPLRQCDYTFLRYDSFLCCSDLILINKTKLSDSIHDRRTQIKGVLKDDDIKSILEITRRSKVYSNEDKDTYFK